MGKLNVVVLYDRWEEPEEADAPPRDKAPLTRTLDKKEVEDEVAETLGKLGHEATLHVPRRVDEEPARARPDGLRSRLQPRRVVRRQRHRRLLHRRLPRAARQADSPAPDRAACSTRQDKAVAKKILEFHGIHTPVFARSFRGRLDFSHDLEFPVIVKPAREDGSIGIEFNAVVSSIRELMERIDWLHANFDSPVLIEEYVEGREMYVGVHRQRQPDGASGHRARSLEAAGRDDRGSPAPK